MGVVLAPTAGATLRLPEVLLRVTAGTACEQAAEELTKGSKSQRGRRPNERAITLAGKRVERTEDFAPALERARASGQPAVLHCLIDPETISPATTLSAIREKALAGKG